MRRTSETIYHPTGIRPEDVRDATDSTLTVSAPKTGAILSVLADSCVSFSDSSEKILPGPFVHCLGRPSARGSVFGSWDRRRELRGRMIDGSTRYQRGRRDDRRP